MKTETELWELSENELLARLDANGVSKTDQAENVPVQKKRAQVRRFKKPPQKPEILPVVNMVRLPAVWKNAYINSLDVNQKKLTEHLFTKVAAIESAIPVALEDAKDCVRMATGAEEVDFTISSIMPAFNKALEISTLRVLCSMLGLSDRDTQMVINNHMDVYEKLPKLQKTAIVPRPEKISNVPMQKVRGAIPDDGGHKPPSTNAASRVKGKTVKLINRRKPGT